MPVYGPEENSKTAKIVFVGEAPTSEEIRTGQPFMGVAGRIHNECLEHAGILRHQTYTTNVFDFPVHKPKGDKANFFSGASAPQPNRLIYRIRGGFTELGLESVARLERELAATAANVICPLGGPALLAICGKHAIMNWRGSILSSSMPRLKGRKCIPSIHPMNASYGQHINRYIIKEDYRRATHEASFPEIHRPDYKFILYPTFRECCQFLIEANRVSLSPIAIDIEVIFGQCERIAFAWSHTEGISVPFLGWTESQEAELWRLAAALLENQRITKIFQNGTFDCLILAQIHGVVVAPPIEDTMIAHSIMYPDFKKGLGFLGSLYTDQPYWKGMVKHGDIDNPEG